MRAIAITRPGPPEVLRLREFDAPVAGPGEVLLDVVATAVNRADLMQREGHYPPPPGASEIPGLECSGLIAALGPDVAGWTVGQQVCALLTGGGYAEQVRVPVGQLMPVPAGVSLLDAAALPEVACTVHSMVFGRGRLQPGENFLVHGGSSGIGTMAVQLAARYGARVFVTAGSSEKLAFCRELGADVTINYREQDFVEVVEQETGGAGVDVILDNMGASYLARNLSALAVEGRLVILGFQGGMTGEIDLSMLLRKRATITAAGLRAQSLAAKAEIVAATVEFVWPSIESGQVRPVVDRVLPLDRAAEAHQLVESSTHVGKVLLQVRSA